MQGETVFKKRVLKDLKKFPHKWFLKTQERARRGVPDVIAGINGFFVAIELKDKDEEPTPLQAVVLAKIQAGGNIAFSATPKTWPKQYEQLKKLVR